MTPRVILSLPISHPDRLAPFVERCLAERVELLAICGRGASAVQDDVFDILVGDGTGDARDLLTSIHEKGLADALELFIELHPETPYSVHRI